jgi:AraC family transcriptional activator of tynA and feaB
MEFFSKVFAAENSASYLLSTACFSVEVNPLDKENYVAAVDVAELGPLSLALVHNRSCIVVRKGEESLHPDARRYSIAYVVDGEIMIAHNLGTAALKRGQFILMDNSHPRKMFIYKSVRLLLVCVPHALLQRHIPVPEEVLGQVMTDSLRGGASSLFAPLLSLWEPLKKGELEEFSTSIGDEILNDIGAVYAREGTARQRSRHALRLAMRVRQYIEANYGDATLSSEAIASEFKISSRYLRSLFQGGERLSQFIQRRRIEESARLLASPQHGFSSITDIAYLCGFNSSTHFARCFRSQFNETAREFRQRHLKMQKNNFAQPGHQ